MNQTSPDIVIDDGRARWSDLWKKEDYWAIWLGFAVILLGFVLFISNIPTKFQETIDSSNAIMEAESDKAPFRTIEYYNAQSAKKKLAARSSDAGKSISWFLARPGGWKTNPLDSFLMTEDEAKAANEKAKAKADKAKAELATALAEAQIAQNVAAAGKYKNAELNAAAEAKIAAWRKAGDAYSKASAAKKPMNLFLSLGCVLIGGMIFFGIGMICMGHNIAKFAIGFIGVFAVAVLAFMMGSQATMKYYGIGSEAWAIILGMGIANTIGTAKWIKPAIQTEFYIKTGLVCLGAEVLFDKIIAIGIPGIFVAWVVTPTVLICTFIFGQKVLKMPSKTLNITISADMSVCGTSAAIATAAACRAKKEELTLAVGLSLVFTAIMMIAMPAFINAVGMPEVLGGAWIGGTVDSTGAVAAAGAFIGQKAMYVAATIKMIQNVLIGVTAFGVAVYWTTKVEPAEQGYSSRKVGAGEIWNRFPKFVIGFLLASIFCSFISGSLGSDMSGAVVSEGLVKGLTSPMRSWCFALAFTSIGLGTNFRELAPYFKGGKPLILYVSGQSFNLVLTLLMAYVMFYLVFPDITAKI
ncbi:YeiH family protein [Desulfococcaceae bacterium OttesenSCG-928-F15]|nr:YeiH family protein [Desulfococcaceae bacterium OttesenSCG-928-F15]